MKKRGFSLMLCIALVFTMSASAFAADITEASITVTKTVEAPPAQDVGSSVGPSNESSYEINIPASFSMDSAEFFEITASKMELEEKQELHVMVDYDRTFGPDGYFYPRECRKPLPDDPLYDLEGVLLRGLLGDNHGIG